MNIPNNGCSMVKSTNFVSSPQLTDLRRIQWDINAAEFPGTQGTYLKAVGLVGGRQVFYKLSLGDTQGIYGHETVIEVIVSRVLDLLGLPHLRYDGRLSRIILDGKEHTEYVCISDNFKKPTESKMAFDQFYDLYKQANRCSSPIELVRAFGWQQAVDEIILADFIIANRDRHGANIEVLQDNVTGSLRIAPLFDNGLSLTAPCQNNLDRVVLLEPLRDFDVQCFIGTRSLYKNLDLISKPVRVTTLTKSKLVDVLNSFNLDWSKVHMSDEHIEKILEMLWGRYCYARDHKVLCEE